MVQLTKKHKYYTSVIFNNEQFEIENEVIIKYKISTGKEFTKNQWDNIIKDNKYYYFDRLGKNKLKRLVTTHELKTFLLEKDAPINIVNKLIEKYEKYKFLNDEYYVKSYIQSKMTKEGPRLIFTKLSEKGISEDLINKELNKLNESQNIELYINSKVGKIKNKTKKQIKNQLKKELTNKGFNYSIVNNLVDQLLLDFNIDESKIIEKEFNKIYKRHFKTKETNELKYFIKQKLYQKGFNIEDINNIINKYIN